LTGSINESRQLIPLPTIDGLQLQSEFAVITHELCNSPVNTRDQQMDADDSKQLMNKQIVNQ